MSGFYYSNYNLSHSCQRASSLPTNQLNKISPQLGRSRAPSSPSHLSSSSAPSLSSFNSSQSSNGSNGSFNGSSIPIWSNFDRRFFWNFHLMKQFIENEISDWFLAVIDGYIHIEHCSIHNIEFDYLLISRRDCSRTGARYHTRGADTNGNVANFVETEQIILCDLNVCSWVETRGSIPVLWVQSNKGLKPKPEVIPSPFTVLFFFFFFFFSFLFFI